MSHSQSDHHEAIHDTQRSARITQSKSPQGGRHFIGFPSDSSEAAPCGIHPAWRNAPYCLGYWREDPSGVWWFNSTPDPDKYVTQNDIYAALNTLFKAVHSACAESIAGEPTDRTCRIPGCQTCAYLAAIAAVNPP